MIRALALLLVLWGGAGWTACRQALLLGLDVSGSVDAVEYGLQRDGLAAALLSPAVRAVLLAPGSAPVRLSVFEWSGPQDQVLILPWTVLDDDGALDSAAARISSAPRAARSPTTALGSAMLAGGAMLAGQGDCWKRTLDLSGDGPANTGPRPQDVRGDLLPPDVTVNGLTIGADARDGGDDRGANIRELSSYYRAYVIRGPGAFVETALGFTDFAAAMERKLLRELQSITVSSRPVMPDHQ